MTKNQRKGLLQIHTTMKKSILLLAVLLTTLGASAQRYDDSWMLNHFSVGAGLGIINGASIEMALPVTPYLAVRGGYNFMNNLKGSNRFNMVEHGSANHYLPNIPRKVELESKLKLSAAHVLVDLYPSKNSSFHFTGGAYFGSDNIVRAYNKDKEDIAALKSVYEFNNRIGSYEFVPDDLGGSVGVMVNGTERVGLEMGDYLLEPDKNGQIDVRIKVQKVRPYVGLGFGRAVPMKHRVACAFDMGLMIWGKPEVYLNNKKATDIGLDGKDDNFLKSVSKVNVGPIISFRVSGRIF